MKKLNLYEVKAQLSKYIEMVESGETVIVCKRNIPVAEIRPIAQKVKKKPELGWAKGKFKIPADFDELPDAAQWEGDEADPLRKYDPSRQKSVKKRK
jgi:antitoxin (DNA-binding transcriptional repressor) of toxin-antitoxin stability system